MTPEGLKIQWAEKLNRPVDDIKKLEAGSTFPSFVIESENKNYLIKTCDTSTPDFQFEVTGLKQLKMNGAPVPEVLVFDDQMLVMDFIQTQAPTPDYWSALGSALAHLHQQKSEFFGFFEDNMIGRAKQKNTGGEDIQKNWAQFFWQNRILFKLNQLSSERGFNLPEQRKDNLKEAIFGLLESHKCHPSPLHGDLWNGNILCGPGQGAFFIDPAFYFGDRETDLAMTECFGGFSEVFYHSYNSVYPLDSGYENRKHLYNLYHMLNHFLIFGPTYETPCEAIIDQLLNN